MYTVSTGNTIQAADVNQIVNALQRPAGQQETGKYYLSAGADAASREITEHIRTTSQGSTPTGVVIDTVDQAASNINAPAAHLTTQFSFQVFSTSTGAANNCTVGGNTTVSF